MSARSIDTNATFMEPLVIEDSDEETTTEDNIIAVTDGLQTVHELPVRFAGANNYEESATPEDDSSPPCVKKRRLGPPNANLPTTTRLVEYEESSTMEDDIPCSQPPPQHLWTQLFRRMQEQEDGTFKSDEDDIPSTQSSDLFSPPSSPPRRLQTWDEEGEQETAREMIRENAKEVGIYSAFKKYCEVADFNLEEIRDLLVSGEEKCIDCQVENTPVEDCETCSQRLSVKKIVDFLCFYNVQHDISRGVAGELFALSCYNCRRDARNQCTCVF